MKEPMTSGKGVTNHICKGTFIHPLLIPHIASWINFEFAYNVSDIIHDFSVKYYKAKYEATQNALMFSDLELSNSQLALNQVLQ